MPSEGKTPFRRALSGLRPPTGSRVQAVCRHTGATFRQPPPILPEAGLKH
ncbi:hypothetical protein [Neisseria lactamica]|nr:hypothetical protein [Neisseria lactamica]